MVWDGEDGRTTVESYWILDVNQELESSNPKGFFLPVDSSAKPRAEAERLHLSYTLWVEMDMTERPAQRISRKMDGLGWGGRGIGARVDVSALRYKMSQWRNPLVLQPKQTSSRGRRYKIS